jgi:DNA-binding transcriptional regulator YdaS (Cro superfamily)
MNAALTTLLGISPPEISQVAHQQVEVERRRRRSARGEGLEGDHQVAAT